jgi:inorganic pyrophosphatase
MAFPMPFNRWGPHRWHGLEVGPRPPELVHAYIDDDEGDVKIIAMFEQDNLWQEVREIDELPDILVERLRYYFGTYKLVPGTGSPVEPAGTYDRDRACKVIEASMEDYAEEFGG